MRVHFSVAFKRIFAFHGFFEMFVTLQCDLEARQPFSFLKDFVDQSFAVKIACSKRSDSGERCEVKKAMKSRGGLGRTRTPFYFAPLTGSDGRFARNKLKPKHFN